jgi:hypothetical protein
MAIITLSRELGASGSEIATGVAKALGLRIIDREIIDQAALKAGVPEVAMHEISYEGRRGLMQRMLDALRASPAIPSIMEMQQRESVASVTLSPKGILTPAMPLLSAALDDYVRIVGMVIVDIAKQNNVLIVGRGSQMVLRDNPNTLHIQVVAPLSSRVEKLMRLEGQTKRKTTQRIVASDRARAEYLGRYYGVNWLDPQLYDLVINTGRVSVQTAVQLVVLTQVQRILPDVAEPRK